MSVDPASFFRAARKKDTNGPLERGFTPMKTVLFVCVGNSCRSQMAEAFFNEMAPEGWRGISAGTRPAEAVSSEASEAMGELGIDMEGARPKGLTPEMLEDAERIITMGCGVGETCPALFDREGIEDWGLEDPRGKTMEEVRRVRDEIRGRVEALVRSLQSI
jgi:arsenate reductase